MARLPNIIPVSILEELYSQGAEEYNMLLYVMAKYSGKFPDELEEEEWTEENIELLEEVSAKAQSDIEPETKSDGTYRLRLQHPLEGLETLIFVPPKIGTLLNNRFAPTGNIALDEFNLQLKVLASVCNISYEQVRQLSWADFNTAGAVLKNFPPFRSRQKD